MAQAARLTLAAIYPAQQAVFDAAFLDYIEEIPAGSGRTLGLEYGDLVATSVLHARLHDGSDLQPVYTPGTLPGQHRPDPLHPDQGFLTPGWGQVRTFAIASAESFPLPEFPALTGDEYTAAFNEVRVKGALDAEVSDRDGNGILDRTDDETEIGIFWGYDHRLGSPVRIYNEAARVVAQQQGNSVERERPLVGPLAPGHGGRRHRGLEREVRPEHLAADRGHPGGGRRWQPGHAGRAGLDAAGRTAEQRRSGRACRHAGAGGGGSRSQSGRPAGLHAALPVVYVRACYVRHRGLYHADPLLRHGCHQLPAVFGGLRDDAVLQPSQRGGEGERRKPGLSGRPLADGLPGRARSGPGGCRLHFRPLSAAARGDAGNGRPGAVLEPGGPGRGLGGQPSGRARARGPDADVAGHGDRPRGHVRRLERCAAALRAVLGSTAGAQRRLRRGGGGPGGAAHPDGSLSRPASCVRHRLRAVPGRNSRRTRRDVGRGLRGPGGCARSARTALRRLGTRSGLHPRHLARAASARPAASRPRVPDARLGRGPYVCHPLGRELSRCPISRH